MKSRSFRTRSPLARGSYLAVSCLGALFACHSKPIFIVVSDTTDAAAPSESVKLPEAVTGGASSTLEPDPVTEASSEQMDSPPPAVSEEPGPTFAGVVVTSSPPSEGEPTEPMPCGNAEVGAGETCDDANSLSGDGCSQKCQLEAGFECTTPGRACVPLCGNGRIDTDEVCDDKNAAAKDGCSSDCQLEKGYECLYVGEPCRKVVCGDGVRGLNEACDDGNTAAKDGCAADCAAIETDFACPTAGAACVNIALCGNAMREAAEECDLGSSNKNTGDCTLACRKPTCGDGFVQTGEQCDDARLSGAYGTCAKGCVLAPYCGDGSVQSGVEACDLGKSNNTGAYGGCNTNCTRAPRCGDGILQSSEECDDGDTSDINGCTNVCRFTSGLRLWYPFNEGSDSAVHDFTTGNDASILLGAKEATATPYTGAFRSGNGSQGGYITLKRISGDDPSNSDEDIVSPLSWVDLRTQLPHSRTATISVWARQQTIPVTRQFLAFFGSGGDGFGGTKAHSTDSTLFSPNHEIWFSTDQEDAAATSYSLAVGITPSSDVPAAGSWVTKPSSLSAHEVDYCALGAKLTLNAWHHVVVTLKSLQNPDDKATPKPVAEISLYVNGQVVGTKTGCYTVNLERFVDGYIGRSGFQENNHSWRGDVDNYMMFDRILTAGEVTDLFNIQKP